MKTKGNEACIKSTLEDFMLNKNIRIVVNPGTKYEAIREEKCTDVVIYMGAVVIKCGRIICLQDNDEITITDDKITISSSNPLSESGPSLITELTISEYQFKKMEVPNTVKPKDIEAPRQVIV